MSEDQGGKNELQINIKKRVETELKNLGFTNIKSGHGYYYFSGFATNPNGGIVYFFSLDTRGVTEDTLRIVYRTATSYKDYTGGQNTQARSNSIKDIAEHLKQFLTHSL